MKKHKPVRSLGIITCLALSAPQLELAADQVATCAETIRSENAYVSSSVNGLVVALVKPKGMDPVPRFDGVEYSIGFYNEAGDVLQVYFYDRESVGYPPITWDAMVQKLKQAKYFQNQLVHLEGETQIMGQRAFQRYLSADGYEKSGEWIDIEKPTLRVIRMPYLGGRLDVAITIRPAAWFPERFEAMDAALEDSLESLCIAQANDLPADLRPWDVIHSGDIRVSQRRDYYLIAHLAVDFAHGWHQREAEIVNASTETERGSYKLLFEKSSEAKVEGMTSLSIVMEGLPVTALSRQDFLAAADRARLEVAPEMVQVNSEEIEYAGTRKLSRRAGQRGESTRATVVQTFEGEDYWGDSIRLRQWVVGGLTLVAHFTYVAPTGQFDEFLPEVERMIDSVQLDFRYPR